MKKLYILILIFTLAGLGYFLYQKFAYIYIIVKFDELEPFERQMNVYFKGFKIGKTTKIYPDENYQNTYIKLKLHPHNIKLPENITAKIKRNKNTEYVSLIYPETASLKRINNNNIIKGEITKDIKNLIDSKFGEDDIDEIIDDATTLMESTNNTIKSLGRIFDEVNEILQDIKGDIKITTSNLAKTSKNLEITTNRLKNSLNEDTMKNSIQNIEETTSNINKTTKNLENITEQIDTKTIPIINSVACDTKEITNGVKKTLKKEMGLSRLFFGKPISD